MREKVDRAKRIIQTASLRDIQLKEASFGRSIRSADEVQDDLQLELGTSYQAVLADRQDERFFVLASLILEIVPVPAEPGDAEDQSSPGAEDSAASGSGESIAQVRAAYELRYELPPGFDADDEELTSFAETNGVFNAWPYFRELVQSSMARMGLPPVFLPLFRVPRSDGPDRDGPPEN